MLAALTELSVSPTLIMPTKANVDKLDALQMALGQMVELKKACDRIESEMRMMGQRKLALLGGGEEEVVVEMEDGTVVKEEDDKLQAERESSIRVSIMVVVVLVRD